jgi:hypothetical protein
MRSGDILKLAAGTPAVLVSSGSPHTAFFGTRGQHGFTATVPTPVAAIASNRCGWSRWQSTRGQKPQWLRFGSAVRLAPTPPPQISALALQTLEPGLQNTPPAPMITETASEIAGPASKISELAPQISEPASHAAEPAELNVTSTPAAPKPPRLGKIELAIDSLSNYDLLKPITVLIEPLGDTVFVAEAPDLNLSTTGNSVGAAFLLLKEQVITTYEGYRSRKGTDADRARQVAAFEQYIGKARRHWF